MQSLTTAIAARDAAACYDALNELSKSPTIDERWVEPLLEALVFDDLSVLPLALELIERSGAPSAVDPVLAVIERERATRRFWSGQRPFHAACGALGGCGAGNVRALAALEAHVTTVLLPESKQTSVRALMKLGRRWDAARAVLERLANSDDDGDRVQAHWALFGIDDDADAHVPTMIAALASKTRGEMVSGCALLALTDVGERALPALDAAGKAKGRPARRARELAASIRSDPDQPAHFSVRQRD
jgi:hypothetical protein